MAVGQLPEPGEPDHAEQGAESGAERFGPIPFEEQHDGRADADQRDDDPHPADEVGEAGIDVVADGPQRIAPQGQSQEDTQGDQLIAQKSAACRWKIDDFWRRRGRSFSGSLVCAPGGGLPPGRGPVPVGASSSPQ